MELSSSTVLDAYKDVGDFGELFVGGVDEAAS